MNLTWQACTRVPHVFDAEPLREHLMHAVGKCYSTIDLVELREKVSPGDFSGLLHGVIVDHCGEWARWWSFSAGDGGFVTSWCCPTHSALLKSDASVENTVNRAVNAVVEWHGQLHSLAELFDRLSSETEGLSLASRVEHAAPRIAVELLRINDATDAWYYTFQCVVEWFLCSLDVAMGPADEQLEAIFESNFSSWVEPPAEVLQSTATKIGSLVAEIAASQTTSHATSGQYAIDATNMWLTARQHWATETRFVPAGKVQTDEHLAFVHRFDIVRDSMRGESMLKALAECRTDAGTDRLLDWEMLRKWQEIVLGREVDFRGGDAFAKGGHEKYPLHPGTPKQFKKLLAEANSNAVSPVALASRVYLDICFFHPFDDGNARSARLALEFVLCRDGLAVVLPEIVFRVSRAPRDFGFRRTLEQVIGERCF